jgi:hypothetical protein
MTNDNDTKKTPKRPKRGEPISLKPLTVEEAVRGLLETQPAPKEEKKKKRKKADDTDE